MGTSDVFISNMFVWYVFCATLMTIHAAEIPDPPSISELSEKGEDFFNLNEINSKVDKLHYIVSNFETNFKWENSILTEIAQTQAYVLKEIRSQEKRIKRNNRLIKQNMRRCEEQPSTNDVIPGPEEQTPDQKTRRYRSRYSDRRRYLIP